MSKKFRRIVLEVSGMRDNQCRELVLTVLGQIEGVVQVEVSLMRGRAVVDCTSQAEAPALVAALEAAGYQAVVTHQ